MGQPPPTLPPETVDRATRLLERVRDGDEAATDRLLPLVYDELRALAGHYLRGERSDHTLQPTALVHEAFLRLVRGGGLARGREAFLAVGARAMRRVLIDHARARGRDKRGGSWQRVSLDQALGGDGTVDLVALNDVLERLAEVDPRGAQVVELRFFGGLGIDEVAGVLDVSPRTVDNDWFVARGWLARALEADGGA